VPPGERAGIFEPFSPNVTFRSIAKIAHGAAVAELGVDAFEPFLPDIIMGRSPYISRFIGCSPIKGRRQPNLHEIVLSTRRGFVVAQVQLFAKFGLRPFLAVVGQPKEALLKWHRSSALTVSTQAQ
jgi:hypothetical protein